MLLVVMALIGGVLLIDWVVFLLDMMRNQLAVPSLFDLFGRVCVSGVYLLLLFMKKLRL
ncbi:MAG: hypothetical protein LBD77_01510 [Bifidobacteriaceae bacterium]|nr:hypothetical protein [Bifidobacteriaceae bacterium]